MFEIETIIKDNKEYRVLKKYIGSNDIVKEVIIPSNIDEIGEKAFGDVSLYAITMQEGVKIIGREAFKNSDACKIELPESLIEIKEKAFKDSAIDEIEIKEGLKVIEDYAFEGCFSLDTIRLPKSLEKLGFGAFKDSCIKNVYIESQLIKTIEPYTFSHCEYLESVICYAKEIGDNAFEYCFALQDAPLEYAKIIGDYAFAYCQKLESIYFEPNVIIGNYAFMNYCNLAFVKGYFSAKNIGNNVFEHCDKLTNNDFH